MVKETTSVPCRACGRSNDPTAAACASCGRALRPIKDRSIALILAVFLSFVTFAYTFRRDWPKFWIGLVVTAAGLLASIAAPGWVVLAIGVWLWSVTIAGRRSEDFYLAFPAPPPWQ